MTTYSNAPRASSRKNIKKAWLLTWEHDSDCLSVRNRFAAILSSRYGDTRVRAVLEQYYVSNYLSIPEQLSYVKSKESCPYKVQYCSVAISKKLQVSASLPSHSTFAESMIIGGNPYLWARIVHDLETWINGDGLEHLKWKERENLVHQGVKITWDLRDESLTRE